MEELLTFLNINLNSINTSSISKEYKEGLSNTEIFEYILSIQPNIENEHLLARLHYIRDSTI